MRQHFAAKNLLPDAHHGGALRDGDKQPPGLDVTGAGHDPTVPVNVLVIMPIHPPSGCVQLDTSSKCT